MKFLAFGDSHGDIDAHEILLAKALDEKLDVIVCIGDFTVFGMHMNSLLKRLNEITIAAGTKLLMIHGNHESEAALKKEVAKYPDIIWLHEKTYKLGAFEFVGFGGGGFHDHEPDFVTFTKTFQPHSKQILLTHQPPINTTLDEVSTDWHVGNQDFREFIENHQPIIALSGHIHETFGFQDLIRDSLLLNPGPIGQIIEIPENEETQNE